MTPRAAITVAPKVCFEDDPLWSEAKEMSKSDVCGILEIALLLHFIYS